MTDHQQSRPESTERMQQTTTNQGQEAIEQAIDLQRNMARMALSALQWQETAQQQGLEMTKSMMRGFPGQQITRSIMERYLQGLEAIAPEMERAMEKGMRAAAQPGMEMGREMEHAGQRMEHASQSVATSRMGHQHSGGRTGGQWSARGAAGGTDGQRMSDRTGGQQTSGPSQRTGASFQESPRQQYPQTGEWVSREGTYGGESSGTMGGRAGQRIETHGGQQGTQSRQLPQGTQLHPSQEQSQFSQQESRPQSQPPLQDQGGYQSRAHRERSQTQPTGQDTGVPSQRGQEERSRGDEFRESTQRRQSGQQQPGGGHQRDRYSQRIDADRNEGDRARQRQPIAQGRGRGQRGEPSTAALETADSSGLESDDVEAERDSDTDEMSRDEMEHSSERSEGETDDTAESESTEGDEESE